jgi:Four helix bundle sensory module for signal transduction
MEQNTKRRLYALLPWVITLTVLGTFTYYGVIYKSGYNPFVTQPIKVDLVSSMRIHLLEAIEAEKNAVLAITDEESEAFAAQTRQAADSVEKKRKEIEPIIHQDKFQRETGLLNEFNACWSQYRKLDETILNLAVQNTNLKAQKISSTQCAQEMARLEESLTNIIQRNNKKNQCDEAVMPAYEALTASFKIFALHKPHIEEANDKQMDKIEQSIKSYDKSAKKALNTLSGIAALRDNPDLKNAQMAYNRFMSLTSEVLRLSRMNTNIKSAELSLGKKRLVSSQCQEILTTLQETVQAQGNYSLPRLKKGGNNFGSTFQSD